MRLSELIQMLQNELAEKGDGKLVTEGSHREADLYVAPDPNGVGFDFSHEEEAGSILDLWLIVDRDS